MYWTFRIARIRFFFVLIYGQKNATDFVVQNGIFFLLYEMNKGNDRIVGFRQNNVRKRND